MVWVKDKKGVWKLFKEAVDGYNLPKSLPELEKHWGRNGPLGLYNDDDIEAFELNF